MRSIFFIYKSFSLVAYFFLMLTASAQNNVDALEKSGLKKIFQSTFPLDQGMDSIKLIYFENKLRFFQIFSGVSQRSGAPQPAVTVFDLDYEGDLFYLKTEYPKFYFGIKCPKLQQENWVNKEKYLNVTLSPKLARFSVSWGFLGATAKPDKIKELEAYLTKNYNPSIIPTRDSILIIQTIVEKETGTLGKKEILHGEKGAFYDFVFEPDPKHQKDIIYQGFFKPYALSSRDWRSFADIYVRLNADGTFTVSTTGVARKFKIKNFKEDPDNPMFYLYD